MNIIGYKHGDLLPCRTCHNPNTRLDLDTPQGEELPAGEWTWFNTHTNQWECSECWLK